MITTKGCKCNQVLQPVKWNQERTLWCCPRIRLPESMRFAGRLTGDQVISSVLDTEGNYCHKVVEFLNANDKPEYWHEFRDKSCFTLKQLCLLKAREPLTWPFKQLFDMIECLNSYDTNLEQCYELNVKKRKRSQESAAKPPVKKRRVTRKRKCDPVAASDQHQLSDFAKVVITTHKSDAMKRNDEIKQAERVQWLHENCRMCNCFFGSYVENKIVKPFDREGNPNRNCGRTYWACHDCNFFTWQ